MILVFCRSDNFMPGHKESSDDGYISLPLYQEQRYMDRRKSEGIGNSGSAFAAVKNTNYDQQSNFSWKVQG